MAYVTYITYEIATGLVRACGSTSSLAGYTPPEGLAVMEVPGPVNWATSRVVGGDVVEIPERPSVRHVWQDDGWVDPTPAAQLREEQWRRIRHERNALLRNTDWVVLRGSETGAPAPLVWRQYRQALRDITTQPDPFNIVWPAAPAS